MINKIDVMYFEKGLDEARSLFLQGKYQPSVMKYGELLHTLFKYLYEKYYTDLTLRHQEKIIKSLDSGLKKKSYKRFTLGQWIDFYEKSDFFSVIEQNKKKFKTFNLQNSREILRLRKLCEHHAYIPSKKEIIFVSETLNAIMEETLNIKREIDSRLIKEIQRKEESKKLKKEEELKRKERKILEKYLKEMKIILAENSPIEIEEYFELEEGVDFQYNLILDIYGAMLNDQNEFVILAGVEEKSYLPQIAIEDEYIDKSITKKIMGLLIEKIPYLEKVSIYLKFCETKAYSEWLEGESINLTSTWKELQKRLHNYKV